jgi:hypothetical protein
MNEKLLIGITHSYIAVIVSWLHFPKPEDGCLFKHELALEFWDVYPLDLFTQGGHSIKHQRQIIMISLAFDG